MTDVKQKNTTPVADGQASHCQMSAIQQRGTTPIKTQTTVETRKGRLSLRQNAFEELFWANWMKLKQSLCEPTIEENDCVIQRQGRGHSNINESCVLEGDWG